MPGPAPRAAPTARPRPASLPPAPRRPRPQPPHCGAARLSPGAAHHCSALSRQVRAARIPQPGAAAPHDPAAQPAATAARLFTPDPPAPRATRMRLGARRPAATAEGARQRGVTWCRRPRWRRRAARRRLWRRRSRAMAGLRPGPRPGGGSRAGGRRGAAGASSGEAGARRSR